MSCQKKMYNLLLILRFQSDKLFENVRDVSLEEKISVEDDDIIDLFDIF